MRGNQFGKMLSMTTFGESHGLGYGVVLDGVPPGLSFSLGDLAQELKRRSPGQLPGTTSRKEDDHPEILSGVFEGKTLGTPLAIFVKNTQQKSSDYNALKDSYRPGHADKTTLLKYGIRDHRGGGRSSGRETLCRVIGGYVASLILGPLGVKVRAYASKLGPFELDRKWLTKIDGDFGPYFFPDLGRTQELENYLINLKTQGESIGGQVSIIVENPPVGLGEPVFEKLKAEFARALLSIGACTAFSYGLGPEFADHLGSAVTQTFENFGGLEGGITSGERLQMEVTFRPPSTVGENAKQGRHDPCVVPRAIPVVEAMVKFVLADHYLRQAAYAGFLPRGNA